MSLPLTLPVYYTPEINGLMYSNGYNEHMVTQIFLEHDIDIEVTNNEHKPIIDQTYLKNATTNEKYVFPIAVTHSVVPVMEDNNLGYFIPSQIVSDCIRGLCKIILHQPNEGATEQYFLFLINNTIRNHPGLTPKHFIVISLNMAFAENPPPFNFINSSLFEREAQPVDIFDQAVASITQKALRDNKFIMLSKRSTPARFSILAEIYDIIDQGAVGVAIYDHPIDIQRSQIEKAVTDCMERHYPTSLKKFNELNLLEILPIVLDVNEHINGNGKKMTTNINVTMDSRVDKFLNSSLHVVLETFENDCGHSTKHGSSIIFSEKIFKAIAHMQPFVLIDEPNNLARLKNIGYKTFDRWIDESYDNEVNDQKRILMAAAEIKKFCSQPKEKIAYIMYDMLPTLEYNYNNLINNRKSLDSEICNAITSIL